MLRHTNRCRHIDAAGAADEQPFFAQQPIDTGDCFSVFNVHRSVNRRTLHIGGYAANADAFSDRTVTRGLQSTVADELKQSAARRVGEYGAHAGILRLEIFRHTSNGAAGTAGGDEGVDASFRLLPDFRARGLNMGTAIGRVVELIGPDCVRQFGRHAPRHFLIVIRIAVGHGLDAMHFSTERFDQCIFFRRLIVRHDNDTAVAASVADMCQTDAGVAGGTLNDRAACWQ